MVNATLATIRVVFIGFSLLTADEPSPWALDSNQLAGLVTPDCTHLEASLAPEEDARALETFLSSWPNPVPARTLAQGLNGLASRNHTTTTTTTTTLFVLHRPNAVLSDACDASAWSSAEHALGWIDVSSFSWPSDAHELVRLASKALHSFARGYAHACKPASGSAFHVPPNRVIVNVFVVGGPFASAQTSPAESALASMQRELARLASPPLQTLAMITHRLALGDDVALGTAFYSSLQWFRNRTVLDANEFRHQVDSPDERSAVHASLTVFWLHGMTAAEASRLVVDDDGQAAAVAAGDDCALVVDPGPDVCAAKGALGQALRVVATVWARSMGIEFAFHGNEWAWTEGDNGAVLPEAVVRQFHHVVVATSLQRASLNVRLPLERCMQAGNWTCAFSALNRSLAGTPARSPDRVALDARCAEPTSAPWFTAKVEASLGLFLLLSLSAFWWMRRGSAL